MAVAQGSSPIIVNPCKSLLRLRVYTVLAGFGICLLILFVIWREHSQTHTISERQFDLDRSIEQDGLQIFRVRFKHKKVPILASGLKAFPKEPAHRNRVEHASESEQMRARTRMGSPLAPFVLIEGDNNDRHTAASWAASGTMKLITGFNHDAYAVNLPGQGETHVSGKLGSPMDFYKGLFKHWHWPRVIIMATGTSIDHIIRLAMDDLAQFETHIEGVIFVYTGDTDQPVNLQKLNNIKMLTRVKVLLIYAGQVNSPVDRSFRQAFDELVTTYKMDMKALPGKSIALVHEPILKHMVGQTAKYPHLEQNQAFHLVLANYIRALDNEF